MKDGYGIGKPTVPTVAKEGWDGYGFGKEGCNPKILNEGCDL